MSWRVVVISSRAKLDLKMGYLVIRGTETVRIHLSEIAVLIVESTAVSLTASLISEMIRRKIKVVFCDEQRLPSSELIPCYGSHDTSGKVKEQIAWNGNTKDLVWTEIVSEKSRKQAQLLYEENHIDQAGMLQKYASNVEIGDSTNREGHAAKVYFNALFGMGFSRNADNVINAALNYGYSIVLSLFSREIVAAGYITQLGIKHSNQFNNYNFASDLMEPFRPLVDRRVIWMEPEKFEHDEKMQIVNLLNEYVAIDGKKQTVINAAGIYCRSVFDALRDDDISKLKHYQYEL